MEFDYRAARRQGFSDAEIVDGLGQRRGFDVQGARAAGYSDQEILSRLTQPDNSTLGVVANAFGRGVTGLIGLPGTLADGVQGLVNAGYNAATGRNVQTRGNPLSSEAIQGGLREAGILDRPGTEPQSEGQRYLAAAAEGAGAGLPFGLAGAALGAAGGATGELGADLARDAGAGEGVQAGARIAGNIVGGVGAGMAANAAGRAIAPVRAGTPERAALVAAAEREGISLTPGQRSGSRLLQRIEQGFADIPLTQPREQALRAAQQDAFTAAALRRAGLTGNRATPAVLERAERQIGAQIGLIARRNQADFSGQAANDLLALAQDAAANAAGDIPRLVQSRVMEVMNRLNSNNAMPGRAWRELDTQIRRQIQSNRANGDLVNYLGRLRDVMMDALEAGAGPAEIEALRAARRAYANLMTIQNAASRAGADAAEGIISPAGLRGAAQQSTGRRGYATGRGDFNELARAGEVAVRPQIPDSGTFGRAAIGGALGGGALAMGADPLTAGAAAIAPMLAQRAYYSPLMQLYLSAPGGLRGPLINALPSVPQGAAVGTLGGASTPEARRMLPAPGR